MPTYCYSNANNEVVERVYPFGKAPPKIRVKGVSFVRDLAADQRGVVATPSTTGEFNCGDALGIHPEQFAEGNASLVQMGLKGKARYARNGDLIVSNHRGAYRETMLAMGMWHRNAGYSDVSKDDVKRYREQRGEPPR